VCFALPDYVPALTDEHRTLCGLVLERWEGKPSVPRALPGPLGSSLAERPPFFPPLGRLMAQPGLCCVPIFNPVAPTHFSFLCIPLQILHPPDFYSCVRCPSTFDITTFPFPNSTQSRLQSFHNLFASWHFRAHGFGSQSCSGLCSGPAHSFFFVLPEPLHSPTYPIHFLSISI